MKRINDKFRAVPNKRASTNASKPTKCGLEEVELIREEHDRLMDVKKAEESSPILKKVRQQWSCHKGHFEDVMYQLREEMAQEQSSEVDLTAARKLLEEPSNDEEIINSDERSYRDEQAMFWFVKAFEKGCDQALSNMIYLIEQNRGLTSRNYDDVMACIVLSPDEYVGFRIGKKLFRSLNHNGRGGRVKLERLMNPNLLSNLTTSVLKYEDKLGPLYQSDLIEAGGEYTRGSIPKLDVCTLRIEFLANSVNFFSLMLLLWYYVHEICANFLTQVVLMIMLLGNFYIGLVSLENFYVFFIYTCIIYLSLCIVINSTLLEKRRIKWSVLWALPQYEEDMASNKYSVRQTLTLVPYLLLAISIWHNISHDYFCLSESFFSISFGIAAIAIIVSCRCWNLFLIFLHLCLLLRHILDCQEDISTFLYFLPCIKLLKTYGDFFYSLFLILSLLKGATETLPHLSAFVILQCSSRFSDNLFYTICLGFFVMVIISFRYGILRRRTVIASLFSVAFFCCVLPDWPAPLNVSWADFRQLCPGYDNSVLPMQQEHCLKLAGDVSFTWTGKIHLVKLFAATNYNKIGILDGILSLPFVETCNGIETKRSNIETTLCSHRTMYSFILFNYISRIRFFFGSIGRFICHLELIMNYSGLFSSEHDILDVELADWQQCRNLVVGNVINVTGIFNGFSFRNPAIRNSFINT